MSDHQGFHVAMTPNETGEGLVCQAVCNCGWHGPARAMREVANEDGLDHVAGHPVDE